MHWKMNHRVSMGYPVYLSGCGKVNATIATMKAIYDGADLIINYGSAGAITDIKGSCRGHRGS